MIEFLESQVSVDAITLIWMYGGQNDLISYFT
jgi:hypothetical protein